MLPFRLPPFPDEILSSWIIRTAVANGTDPLGIGYGIWQEWRGWTRDVDRQLPETYQKQIASLTGIDQDRIRQMTLELHIARLYPNGVLPGRLGRWSGVIPLGGRNRSRTNGLHFCPECLGEGIPYARQAWRVAWVSACPKHKRQLALTCPKCHHVFSPHMIRYDHPYFHRCVQCGFDLTRTETPRAYDKVLLLQESLNRAIWERHPVNEIFSGWFKEDELSEAYTFLSDLLRLFRYVDINPKLSFVSVYKAWTGEFPAKTFQGRITGIESLSAADRHLYWHMVAHVLHRGEEAFVSLLRSHEITHATVHNAALRSMRASHTLRRIAAQLDHTSAGKRTRRAAVPKRNIEPRSPQEVEAIMQTIRQYM